MDDAVFAQGFVTAQDRLWQMDMLRRHAAGDLAEILGASMIEHDRLQRTLQIRAAAALPADQLHSLEVYANGVNAFIAQATDPHNEHLPVEFHVLHYKPAPWTPRDSLLVYLAMEQDLSSRFDVKLRREALAHHLSPRLMADLYPVGSWRDRPPMQPPPDLTTPVLEIQQVPLDRTQSSLALPAGLLHLSQSLTPKLCGGCFAGSNNWAIAGTHTATGLPLVSNDMHLHLTAPDIWYEASLHTTSAQPALDVTGFTLPGVPFIIVGRNAHVAWGFTNLGGDVQDVRIEHTRGSGSSLEYQLADGSWKPVTHHRELIVVRGGTNVVLDVATTTAPFGASTMSSTTPSIPAIETPIITALIPGERRALSLAWTIYDPKTVVDPFLGANLATDGASLVSALSTFGGPSLNLVYADDQNHIGYHALGAIPVRGPAVQRPRALAAIAATSPADSDDDDENADDEGGPNPNVALPAPQETIGYTIGSPISPLPVDALDASQQWSGYVPFASLPAVTDPTAGLVATANARITPDDYPYALTLNWGPAYRVERIYKLLNNRDHLTPADMLAVQNDRHSAFDALVAQRAAYAIDHASAQALGRDAKRLHAASDILRRWNGDVTADSAAAAIVAALEKQLESTLLIAAIHTHDSKVHIDAKPAEIAALYNWSNADGALEDLLQHTPARWLPPGVANWNDLVTQALERALEASHAPSDLAKWHYGPLHTVSIDHPLFSLLPLVGHMLGVPTSSGAHAVGGNATTIRA
ncbi:MAG: penicillin acylase family protein, partial [Bryocella sp.]